MILARVAPLQPQIAITLGSVGADIPHTRALPVRAFTQNEKLAARYGAGTTAHEGFTGITGIVADACDAAGIPALRAWVSVPSYVSTPPSPKGTLALLEEFQRAFGLVINLDDLRERSELWTQRVDELASEQGMGDRVAALENERDLPLEPVGDKLASEILDFLRRRTN